MATTEKNYTTQEIGVLVKYAQEVGQRPLNNDDVINLHELIPNRSTASIRQKLVTMQGVTYASGKAQKKPEGVKKPTKADVIERIKSVFTESGADIPETGNGSLSTLSGANMADLNRLAELVGA